MGTASNKPNPREHSDLLTRESLSHASKEQLIDLVLLLQRQNIELREQNDALRKENAALKKRVAEIERRLGMNSSNSSKPPSSDPPSVKKDRRNKRKSKRKRGAQPGHKPHHRQLVPVDEVDSLEKIVPNCCENCGSMNLEINHDDPYRHQVWEIPQVKPFVKETQLLNGQCHDCSYVTFAELPEGEPTGSFGPRIQAIVSYLTGVGRLSKRMVKAMLKDLFGLNMCEGSVSACEKAVSQAIEQPCVQAHQYVQDRAVLYADETSWWQRNLKFWLWVAVGPLVTVFMIDSGRGRDAARKLLGRFKGILVTDRWKPYRIHKGLRQFCWSHLLRDFAGFSELKGKARRIGQQLVDKTELMFTWWHRIRDGTLTRRGFQRKMKTLRIEIEDLLIEGEVLGKSPMAGKCKEIISECQHLWTFVDHEGVEPTNNTSERTVRHGVMWRRVSFGTQSECGSRFVERILTVNATCRQQNRNMLEYLTEACTARLHNLPAPSLLPSC